MARRPEPKAHGHRAGWAALVAWAVAGAACADDAADDASDATSSDSSAAIDVDADDGDGSADTVFDSAPSPDVAPEVTVAETTAGDTNAAGDTTVDTDAGETVQTACEALPQPPYAVTPIDGFTATEDFQFAPDGRLIAADGDGNLIHIARDGTQSLWVPGACEGRCEGMQFLPNGDLVVARLGDGTLYRIGADGVPVPILGGLAFPDGIEVDPAGFVYVSEFSATRVRQVDPETGKWTVIATGLYSPNGLAFSPDFATLYVAGYGVGVLYAIPLDAARHAGPARVHARLPGSWDVPTPVAADEQTTGACADHVAGAACTLEGAHGYCSPLGDALVCDLLAQASDPEVACEGRTRGDTCYVTGYYQYDTCRPVGGALVCRADDAATMACDLLAEGDACMVVFGPGGERVAGTCGKPSGELACVIPDPSVTACAHKQDGADCSFTTTAGETANGSCGQGAPGDGLACVVADPSVTACDGLASGADCHMLYDGVNYDGACTDYGPYHYCQPFDRFTLACRGHALGDACTATFDDGRLTTTSQCWPFRGGALACGAGFPGELDGLGVDACGNVFATEDDTGQVFRFSADGQSVAVAAHLEGWWVPNLHWGRGAGFDPHKLYVTNFNAAGLFELDVGVAEKARPRP